MSEAQVKSVLEHFKAMESGWTENTSLDQMRGDLASLSAKLSPSHSEECIQIDANGVPCEWGGRDGPDRPNTVLYFHGGGYVVSSARTHRDVAAHMAQAADARVLNVDYRLAPENPFPAALEDAEHAYVWFLEQGGDPQRLVFAGDSAGGGLALALLLKLRDEDRPLPACAVLFSPWADLTCSGESYLANADKSPVGSQEMGLGMAAQYLGREGDPENPYASPMFGSYIGLPPILIQVSDTEVFLDDSLTVEHKAKQAGVEVAVEQWSGVFHAWQIYASAIDEGKEAVEKAAAFIRDKTDA